MGGTGRTFDWAIAREACVSHGNIILAGGLGPSNLQEALEAVRPYAVDLNSGVEVKPGVKNPHKMGDAMRIVRGLR
jgi:phosphoribosylanthranilate isomerase